MKNSNIQSLIEYCIKIRAFENTLLKLFSENRISGTTHTCIGQELSGVVVGAALKEGDVIFSNHRCHGHYLGFTQDFRGLGAEILGRNSGVNQGFGGSQHICIPGKFYSNGILGGMLPYAMGITQNLKLGNISVCYMGDGCFGEGILHEAFNIANIKDLPVLFFVEDNGIAQSTNTKSTNLVSKDKFFEAHNIDVIVVNDENELIKVIPTLINEMRDYPSPKAIIWSCDRHAPHSKGDDTRNEYEIKTMLDNDYLTLQCTEYSVNYDQLYVKYLLELEDLFDAILN
ncbi:thiamine pyrophosphate-dependent enzyme [Amylibacter sp.]|nr:thiamine pyrophosphate-dependent enzyme [Amylibacter sp.]